MSISERSIIVLGDTCCGKSFLIWKFVNHETLQIPTVFLEKYERQIVVNGLRFSLNIWDAGYPAMWEEIIDVTLKSEQFLSADMILLCFDISRFHTLESIREFWMPEIRMHLERYNKLKKEIPYFLVGLQKDLRDNPGDKCHPQCGTRKCVPVSAEEGKLFAEKIKACGYLECSAELNDGVEEVFEAVVREFLKPPPVKTSKFNGFLKKIFGK